MNLKILFLYDLITLTGWLAAGFLFLNFLTCWIMPWAKKCRKICKVEDATCPEEERPLCAYHKPIVWLTIIFASLHIILAVLV